jgi:hypothetical protein
VSKTWEKVGIRLVSKPAAHGSGLYLRIPKKTVDAYDLWTAEVIEFTVERVLQKPKGEEASA